MSYYIQSKFLGDGVLWLKLIIQCISTIKQYKYFERV